MPNTTDAVQTASPRPRSAFTLVELLVVTGLVALLVGLTMPGIAKARRQARDVKCMNNLRQLVAASTMYLNEWKCYPPMAPDTSWWVPTTTPDEVDVGLLDAVGHYLRQPEVDGTMTVEQLPAVFVPPMRKDFEIYDLPNDPYALWGVHADVFWDTGYVYGGTLDTPDNQGVTHLDGTHVTKPRGTRPGVLWADQMMWVDTIVDGPEYSGYCCWHTTNGSSLRNGCLADVHCVLGTHRGWADGRVEWVDAAHLGLRPDQAPTSAGYQFGIPGVFTWFYFF